MTTGGTKSVAETNWAGNYTFGAAEIAQPTTVEAVQELVAQSRKVKALGARHSFNGIADSTETLISLAQLPDMLDIDAQAGTVTVNGAMSYAQLCTALHQSGYAIHNMASLPHISVAGAIATATHGSGDGNGNLATAVVALDVIMADGARVTWRRGDETPPFAGTVVSLGGLGVVVRVTLEIRPTFQVYQIAYEGLPFDRLATDFDGVMGGAYSVSLFTDWQTSQINQVWLKYLHAADSASDMVGQVGAAEYFGARAAIGPLHPSGRSPAASCTEQMGLPGPWHERLPHFRPEYAPASGNELQTEYFVPRAQAVEALTVVAGLRAALAPVLIVTEVRTVAADELWLSPAYGQDCVGIHFSWHNDWPAVAALLPTLEDALAPFGARPHWGKLFSQTIAMRTPTLYPRFADFCALLQQMDPQGKFRNGYLDALVAGQYS